MEIFISSFNSKHKAHVFLKTTDKNPLCHTAQWACINSDADAKEFMKGDLAHVCIPCRKKLVEILNHKNKKS